MTESGEQDEHIQRQQTIHELTTLMPLKTSSTTTTSTSTTPTSATDDTMSLTTFMPTTSTPIVASFTTPTQATQATQSINGLVEGSSSTDLQEIFEDIYLDEQNVLQRLSSVDSSFSPCDISK